MMNYVRLNYIDVTKHTYFLNLNGYGVVGVHAYEYFILYYFILFHFTNCHRIIYYIDV